MLTTVMTAHLPTFDLSDNSCARHSRHRFSLPPPPQTSATSSTETGVSTSGGGRSTRKLSYGGGEMGLTSASWLADRLLAIDNLVSPQRRLFILDCRSSAQFQRIHVVGSANVVLPSILYKRLVKGTLPLASALPTKDLRESFQENFASSDFVLISEEIHACMASSSEDANGLSQSPPVSSLLLKRLWEKGCSAKLLKGGIEVFASQFPHLCSIDRLSSSTDDGSAPRKAALSPSASLTAHQPATTSSSSIAAAALTRRSRRGGRQTSTIAVADDDHEPPRLTNRFGGPLLNLENLSLEEHRSSSSGFSTDSSFFPSPMEETVDTVPSSTTVVVRAAGPNGATLSTFADEQNQRSTMLHRLPGTPSTASAPSTPSHLDACYQTGASLHCEKYQYEKMSSVKSSQPFEIVPNLFLGNAKTSAERATLEKYGIRYILNVTPDLPNCFEDDPYYRYLKISINDHWSQNLASYFPQAIAFIDEAREQNVGVLVHCLAGISRSVTVTVAYLMQTLDKSLEDAYDVVKRQKPNIAPNFNFMGQLLDFERRLRGGSGSPDSGHFSALDDHPTAGHSQRRTALETSADGTLHFLSPRTASTLHKSSKQRQPPSTAPTAIPTAATAASPPAVTAAVV